jgi:hypothetical protein
VLTEQWAQRLAGTGVHVHAMHPGWADTAGVRNWMPLFRALTRPVIRTPEQGADTIVWLGGAREAVETTGLFWHDRRPRPVTYLIGAGADDEAARRELWDHVAGRAVKGQLRVAILRAVTETAGGRARRPCPVSAPRPAGPSAGGTGRRARFRQPRDSGEGSGDAPVDITGVDRSLGSHARCRRSRSTRNHACSSRVTPVRDHMHFEPSVTSRSCAGRCPGRRRWAPSAR